MRLVTPEVQLQSGAQASLVDGRQGKWRLYDFLKVRFAVDLVSDFERLDDRLSIEGKEIDDIGEIGERLHDFEYLADLPWGQPVNIIDHLHKTMPRFSQCPGDLGLECGDVLGFALQQLQHEAAAAGSASLMRAVS